MRVSFYEKRLLEDKKELLSLEGKRLPLGQRSNLRELSAGMNC
jgi:hypothetical protein